MRKKILLTLTLAASLCSWDARAENKIQEAPLKIGYTNVDYLLSFLPETKKVQSEFLTFQKQLQSQLETKGKELQQKMQAFEQGQETMTEAVRTKKYAELENLDKSFQQLRLEFEQKLASKQADLLKPLYDKVMHTVEAVAKKHGYTYVFNTQTQGGPVLLYKTEQYDISEQVLNELGIKPGKEKK